VDIKFNAVLEGTLLGDEHFLRWNTLSYQYGGCVILFYKVVAAVFKVLDVLYLGQHPQSRGISEIKTPPQQGPHFSKDPLLGCEP
jgi:hypothetical protein